MKTIILSVFAWMTFGQEVPRATMPASPKRLSDLNVLADSKSLPPKDKRLLLIDLIKSADEDPATTALSILIREHDPDASHLARELIARSRDKIFLMRVLYDVERHFSQKDRHEVARQILRKVEQGFIGERPGFAIMSLAGYAAELLADSNNPADQNLVQSNWQKDPEEFGYLIALISLGVKSGPGVDLVGQLFSDSSRPLWVRVAAGSILSQQNRSAASFVYSEIDQLLGEVGSRDGLELLQSRTPGTEPKILVKIPVSMVSVLQHLRTPDAELLTFGHLESRNVYQNRALGILAAQRWPDHLINMTRSPDADRKRILAAVVILHPELRVKVSELLPSAELDPLVANIQRTGLQAMLNGPFSPGFVFLTQ